MSHTSLVVHFEIHASEPQRLIDFYSGLFGWTFTQFGDIPYWTIETGEGSVRQGSPGFGINGGLTPRQGPAPEPGAPVNGANFVISTDDVDGVFAKGLELGGTEAVPLDDMAGVGRVGYLLDPDGNVFGINSPVLSDGTNAMEQGGV